VHPIGRVKAIGRLEVAAALAELFPADDGEPVTPEWAKSAGAVRTFDMEPLELFWWFSPTEPWSHTFVKVSFYPDGSTSMGICGSKVIVNPTRGHVRRLLAALGVELREAPPTCPPPGHTQGEGR
jgi:hypothetical protein